MPQPHAPTLLPRPYCLDPIASTLLPRPYCLDPIASTLLAVTILSTVFKGAPSAPGPGWPPILVSPVRKIRRPGRGAASARHRIGLSGKRCAPGRRLPLLDPSGHGGVGERVVPAARRIGWAPQRSAPRARAAKRAIPPAPDHEASQDRGQGRAPRVAARSALRAAPGPRVLPRIPWRLSEGWQSPSPGHQRSDSLHEDSGRFRARGWRSKK
jgi:hypothetical protein